MSESLEEIAHRKDKGPLREMLRSQPFWVTVALVLMCVVMSQMSNVFFTEDNFFNVTRNFAFIGIIAMGMTAVIITGGIDLSVGSVVGISGMITAMVLHAGHSWWAGIIAGLLTALACGLVNGIVDSTDICCRPVSISFRSEVQPVIGRSDCPLERTAQRSPGRNAPARNPCSESAAWCRAPAESVVVSNRMAMRRISPVGAPAAPRSANFATSSAVPPIAT